MPIAPNGAATMALKMSLPCGSAVSGFMGGVYNIPERKRNARCRAQGRKKTHPKVRFKFVHVPGRLVVPTTFCKTCVSSIFLRYGLPCFYHYSPNLQFLAPPCTIMVPWNGANDNASKFAERGFFSTKVEINLPVNQIVQPNGNLW
jgi:hypothetical protein